MKRLYTKLETRRLPFDMEEGFLIGSKVDDVKLEVEVDNYIPIEDMKVSFD